MVMVVIQYQIYQSFLSGIQLFLIQGNLNWILFSNLYSIVKLSSTSKVINNSKTDNNYIWLVFAVSIVDQDNKTNNNIYNKCSKDNIKQSISSF